MWGGECRSLGTAGFVHQGRASSDALAWGWLGVGLGLDETSLTLRFLGGSRDLMVVEMSASPTNMVNAANWTREDTLIPHHTATEIITYLGLMTSR